MIDNVKDWYSVTFPDDTIVEEMNEEVTFKDIFDTPQNVYGLLEVADSTMRERIFYETANRYCNGRYSEIYQRWLIS